jgi:hypothetical protein
MIKKLTFFVFAITTGILLVQMSANTANSSSSGAPAGYCGGPGGLGTCTTCHSGTATPSPTPIISSNVPQTGYVPGSTYTITATMSQSGISEFGFQVSPLSSTGALVGGLVLTNPTQTQIVSLKYVTHTASGTIGSGGSKQWSFNWIAPAAGTGNVTFYGAFNYSNNNGTSSGDLIRTHTLTIQENQVTTGIGESSTDPVAILVYPNPVADQARVSFSLETPGQVIVRLFDLSGREVIEPIANFYDSGRQNVLVDDLSGLNSGVYRVIVSTEEKTWTGSMLKR